MCREAVEVLITDPAADCLRLCASSSFLNSKFLNFSFRFM